VTAPLPTDPSHLVGTAGVAAGPAATELAPLAGPAQGPDLVDAAPISRGRLVLRRFLRRRMAVAGLIVVVVLFLLAYLSPVLYPYKYTQIDVTSLLSPPSARHWFGTTQIGFDMFSLTMRGLQKSLIIGLIGAVLSTAVAATVGAAGGYFGGWVDRAMVAFADLLLVLPSFLIIAIVSPAFRGGTWLIFVLLLAGFQWMITSRVVRGLTLSLKEREFVAAARFMGVPGWRIIVRHILPNMASFLIIDATLNVSLLILLEVGLSFFGFGVQPPDVSLGTLISDHWQSAATDYSWQFYLPSLVLVVLVLAVNLIGDGLRDALDPNARFEGR
jgi:peptide/nickel transport system permease protein